MGCGIPAAYLCRRCHARLTVQPALLRPGPDLRVRAAGAYVGLLRALVLAFKSRPCLALASPLGSLLADVVAAEAVEPSRQPGGADQAGAGVVLVPVPAAPGARRERGFDHVMRLARVAAASLRRRGARAEAVALLEHRGSDRRQKELSATRRPANVAGRLQADLGAWPASRAASPRWALSGHRRPSRPGSTRLVLVDDVITTGATLAEAVRALAQVGMPAGSGCVLASVEPRRCPAREAGSPARA